MNVKAVLYIVAILTALSLANAGESTDQLLDHLIQRKQEDLMATHPLPTELHMTLHDIPPKGMISRTVSWAITNQTGTVTLTSLPIPFKGSPLKLISLSAPLYPSEATDIVAIATNLISTIKSDGYMGWTGPLFGLNFRLDHSKTWQTQSWMKWSTSTNILHGADLASHILQLRVIASNAIMRTESYRKPSTTK